MSESVVSGVGARLKGGKVLEVAVVLLLAVVVAAVVFCAVRGGGEEAPSSQEYADVLGGRLASILSQIEGAAKATDLELTAQECAYLEELYTPHPLVGVMAQNTAATAQKEHVWSAADSRRNH